MAPKIYIIKPNYGWNAVDNFFYDFVPMIKKQIRKFEEKGYKVVVKEGCTQAELLHILSDHSTHGLFIASHGAPGGITLDLPEENRRARERVGVEDFGDVLSIPEIQGHIANLRNQGRSISPNIKFAGFSSCMLSETYLRRIAGQLGMDRWRVVSAAQDEEGSIHGFVQMPYLLMAALPMVPVVPVKIPEDQTPRDGGVPAGGVPAQPSDQTRPATDRSAPKADTRSPQFMEEADAASGLIEVKPDDTLQAIAERHLGDHSRWREIYDIPRNRKTIGDKPDVIHAGQVLVLPTKQAEPKPKLSALDLAREFAAADQAPASEALKEPVTALDLARGLLDSPDNQAALTAQVSALIETEKLATQIGQSIAQEIAGPITWSTLHHDTVGLALEIATEAIRKECQLSDQPGAPPLWDSTSPAHQADIQSATDAVYKATRQVAEAHDFETYANPAYSAVITAATDKAVGTLDAIADPTSYQPEEAELWNQALQTAIGAVQEAAREQNVEYQPTAATPAIETIRPLDMPEPSLQTIDFNTPNLLQDLSVAMTEVAPSLIHDRVYDHALATATPFINQALTERLGSMEMAAAQAASDQIDRMRQSHI